MLRDRCNPMMAAEDPMFSPLVVSQRRWFHQHLGDYTQRLSWSKAPIALHQELALRRLLSWASQNSRFYRSILKDFDLSTFSLLDLKRFPLLTIEIFTNIGTAWSSS